VQVFHLSDEAQSKFDELQRKYNAIHKELLESNRLHTAGTFLMYPRIAARCDAY